MIKVKQITLGDLDNNCYLITDCESNDSALVDCTDYSSNMHDFLQDVNLKFILLTHGHFDHIGGVKFVKEDTNAKVVISKTDEGMLNSGKLSLASFCNAPQNNVDADITVSDGDEIELGESTIKIISTPGHTKGSVCYLVDDYLFSGDTLFFCSCGRTDFPGGSPTDMIESLLKLSKLNENIKVMTGHNKTSTIGYEIKNNPYMR